MSRKRILYLVHHSHTDIGYTDSQEAIKKYHVDYIRYLLDIFEGIENGDDTYRGFRYTCENYWQVEEFYRNSTMEEQKKFEKFVKLGYFEVSLTYLNMTELVDDRLVRKKLNKAKAYMDKLGVEATSAMTADINGFSWGYSQAMYDAGIRNFYSNLHTHHGMFPLFKKQIPFWWETPNGDKLLVWNGDHYQMANNFYFTPNSDLSRVGNMPYNQEAADRQFEKTEERLFAYFDRLDEQQYPYDFTCEMLSGVIADNAAPNPNMMMNINRWNQKHGNKIEVRLSSLQDFFAELRKADVEIPTYRGDWADWWADGVGSTPSYVKVYREAQRRMNMLHKLDPNESIVDKKLFESAEDNLLMFSEHTWGHASSISHPWDPQVTEIELKKGAYAINAHTEINKNLYRIKEQFGEISPQIDRIKQFKILNPHDVHFEGYTKVNIDHWEHVDGSYYSMENPLELEVINKESGSVIPCQMEPTTRGFALEFKVELEPKGSIIVKVQPRTKPEYTHFEWNHAENATDKVLDIADYPGYENTCNLHMFKNNYFDVSFGQNGIDKIIDKTLNKNIVRDEFIGNPFSGIYEKTPYTGEITQGRRQLGRNRKGIHVERDFATLKDIKVDKRGVVSTTITLYYELKGTLNYEVALKFYEAMPIIEAKVRTIKTLERAPENVYISLPFTLGENSVLTLDKSGAPVRPCIDQLPGTNTDFYAINRGISYSSSNNFLYLLMKDTPLVWLGELNHHNIELFEEKYAYKNMNQLYSWPMNNFWETNFKGELSGSYELNYVLLMQYECPNLESNQKIIEAVNEGCLSFAYAGE